MENWNFDSAEENKVTTNTFPVACPVENVRVTKVEYVKQPNYESIDFTLEDANGASLRDKIFAPDPEKIKNAYWNADKTKEEKEAAVTREQVNLMSRLLHYFTKYGITKEKVTELFNKNVEDSSKFSNIAKFAQGLMTKLIKQNPDTLLWVKTVRNKDGWSSLPKTPGGFLQNMSDEECELRYSNKEIENNAKYSNVSSGRSSNNVDGPSIVGDDDPKLSNLDELDDFDL
jgi:hypothetical protein